MRVLEDSKISVGFSEEYGRHLRLAGEVLGGQTRQIVEYSLNGIIASIWNLARHLRTLKGNTIPECTNHGTSSRRIAGSDFARCTTQFQGLARAVLLDKGR
jgi:hypothetical protein